MSQVKTEHFIHGHYSLHWPLPEEWNQAIGQKNWEALDQLAAKSLAPNCELWQILDQYCPVKKIEFILSLRSAPDEAGIWHDDGSREMAFSLALNEENSTGLGLSLRKKNQPDTAQSLGQRPSGELTLFLTGADNYEHRTEEVTAGERLVLAGWVN